MWEIGDRVWWVLRGDLCFVLREKAIRVVDDEGAIAV